MFTLVCIDVVTPKYAPQTAKGNFVIFVSEGGIRGSNSTPIHTDAKWARAGDIFTIKILKLLKF